MNNYTVVVEYTDKQFGAFNASSIDGKYGLIASIWYELFHEDMIEDGYESEHNYYVEDIKRFYKFLDELHWDDIDEDVAAIVIVSGGILVYARRFD